MRPVSTARPPTLCKTSASKDAKGGDHVSKARLIYFAVLALLIVAALPPALFRMNGPHDGAEI
jgi:hypothetical protein